VEGGNGVDGFEGAARGDKVGAVCTVTLDMKCRVRMSVLNDCNESRPVTRQVVHCHAFTTLHTTVNDGTTPTLVGSPNYVVTHSRDCVGNAVFRLLICCSVPETLTMKVKNCPEIWNFGLFFAPPSNTWIGPKLWDQFFKLHPCPIIRQSFATFSHGTLANKQGNKRQQ